MLKALLRGIVELILTAAALALVVATALLVFASWLIAKSPRESKAKTMVSLVADGLTLVDSFRRRADDPPRLKTPKNA